MRRALLRRLAAGALALAGLAVPAAARADAPEVPLAEAARRLAAGGYVLMVRHAQTVAGVGDPAGFRLGDCATQRNLSEEGRAQARRLGEALRAAGVAIAEVRSSQWCRCRDTAQLAFGAYREWSALNSFFGDRADEPMRTAEVIAYAGSLRGPGNVVLVTHQVNISAATGVYTRPGELVAAKARDGRLAPEFRFVAHP